MRRSCLAAAAPIILIAAGPPPAMPAFTYQRTEGQNLNLFLRDGPVAAHALLRNGSDPRILVAFPAGDSGVGLWFDHLAAPAQWRWTSAPQPVTQPDARGRPLHGIRVSATLSGATRLKIKQAVLSSVRFLRDYQAIGSFPSEIAVQPVTGANTLDYHRDRIDGAPGYQLLVRVAHGGRVDRDTLIAGPDGQLAVEITALTGDTPLTPLQGTALLDTAAAPDPGARNALTFLSYREKFLAGSWRFDTYFGRDMLMSLRLLMPVLQPQAVEAGLSSALARLSPGGEAAHEEGLSEFAVLEHRKLKDGLGDKPTLDYGMIDTSFMLGPVMASYLLDSPGGQARAHAYLGAPITGSMSANPSETATQALARNLKFVLEAARPFADDPRAANLVSIKAGRNTGEWRDSNEGLGRGRFAYDVNAALVPAALDAAARLDQAGLLAGAIAPADRALFARAGAMAKLWHAKAPPLFALTIPGPSARAAIEARAKTDGVPAAPALAALGNAPLTFHALSLNADGSPVPILNSDEGFALMFGAPAPADLDTYVTALMRPFPAGLMTDVGLLVANPMLADTAAQARFTPNAYHGEVVWSWQQALFAAGLERQLRRTDLPASVRAHLVAAQATLWRAIEATRAYRSSELWSWTFADGRYRVVPFGAGANDVDESNAAQLWSTVYLAVRPPR